MIKLVAGIDQAVAVLNTNLAVTVEDEYTTVEFIGRNFRDRVRMATPIWREFCKRQLSVPPPLPKGAQT